MFEQEVRYVATELSHRQRFIPEHFQLRNDRPHVWLQKAAIWVLRKLGCYAYLDEQIITKKIIDTHDISKKIVESMKGAVEYAHYEGRHLLVGYEEFQELAQMEYDRPFSIKVPYYFTTSKTPADYGPPEYETRVYQMKVTVIPWMKGVLVLPKDFDKNSYR